MEKAVDDGMLCCIILSSWPKRVDDGAKQDNIGMLFLCLLFFFRGFSFLFFTVYTLFFFLYFSECVAILQGGIRSLTHTCRGHGTGSFLFIFPLLIFYLISVDFNFVLFLFSVLIHFCTWVLFSREPHCVYLADTFSFRQFGDSTNFVCVFSMRWLCALWGSSACAADASSWVQLTVDFCFSTFASSSGSDRAAERQQQQQQPQLLNRFSLPDYVCVCVCVREGARATDRAREREHNLLCGRFACVCLCVCVTNTPITVCWHIAERQRITVCTVCLLNSVCLWLCCVRRSSGAAEVIWWQQRRRQSSTPCHTST